MERIVQSPLTELVVTDTIPLRPEAKECGKIRALGAQMRGWQALFEAMLDGRDYLFGDEVSAADFAAFPFLKYALLHDEDDDDLFHRTLVDYLAPPGPRTEAWIRRIDALPRA